MRLGRDKTTLSRNRWARYAAAGAAGAVAVLGPQASIDAEITVVEVNTILEDRTQGDGYFDAFGPYTFGAAGASFYLYQGFNEVGTDIGVMFAVGFGDFSFCGFLGAGKFYVSNLSYGQAVSSCPFGVSANRRGQMAWGAGYYYSQWLNPGTGYIGFQFDLGGGTQYGWAEVQVNGVPDNRGFFFRYGYGMVGDSVFAGEGPRVIPEPGALGFLALGSVGLLAWRRQRAA